MLTDMTELKSRLAATLTDRLTSDGSYTHTAELLDSDLDCSDLV